MDGWCAVSKIKIEDESRNPPTKSTGYFRFGSFFRNSQHLSSPPLSRLLSYSVPPNRLLWCASVMSGEVCVCGVPRRGIPRVVSVVSAEGGKGAKVVEVPLQSFRKGGLFASSASLDAFLRVLAVGFSDMSRE